jgi:glycosyltransferase involved in cell wall biosynthesis
LSSRLDGTIEVQPVISVVVPTRNRSGKLARALASVMAQTHQDYEIIVIDDASTPQEAALIGRIVDETPKARLIRNEINVGAATSRNLGVKACSGDIIALLDSDDWWVPERLAFHDAALAGQSVVFSYNMAFMTRGGEDSVFAVYNAPPDPSRRVEVALAAWNFVGGCSSVCVRRSAFEQVGGFDETLPSCQDWDLWFRLGRLGEIAFIPRPLTYQDCGRHERITTSRDKAEAGHDVMEAAAARMILSSTERRYIRAHQRRTRAWLEAQLGEPASALKELVRSLLIKPTREALRSVPEYVSRYATSLFSK